LTNWGKRRIGRARGYASVSERVSELLFVGGRAKPTVNKGTAKERPGGPEEGPVCELR